MVQESMMMAQNMLETSTWGKSKVTVKSLMEQETVRKSGSKETGISMFVKVSDNSCFVMETLSKENLSHISPTELAKFSIQKEVRSQAILRKVYLTELENLKQMKDLVMQETLLMVRNKDQVSSTLSMASIPWRVNSRMEKPSYRQVICYSRLFHHSQRIMKKLSLTQKQRKTLKTKAKRNSQKRKRNFMGVKRSTLNTNLMLSLKSSNFT